MSEMMIGYIKIEMTIAQINMFLDWLKADQYRLWSNWELIHKLETVINTERKILAADIEKQLSAL